MIYDAILGLGTFCQVGGALWQYGLKNINTPLDNFGIKTWQNIPAILEKRFEDYWLLENMATGKVVDELSLVHNEKRPILKVYDNKYNLVSNHNFLSPENSSDNLPVYPVFREKLRFLERIFLKQCRTYEKVRFILKASNWPDAENTPVDLDTVERLVNALVELREGRYFDLYLAVPAKCYEKAKRWESDFNEFPVKIRKWEIQLNNSKNSEWEQLFEGFELDPDYYWNLVSGIIDDASINLESVNRF